MNVVIPRLVRVQDRLTLRDSAPVWRINPRTGFLESRAGLSWTGVRDYPTPNGVLRVLRRPEQVNSEGHKRTLRRLPNGEGHPANGVDITAANSAELVVGYTGDVIDVEMLDGYARPVGDVSVFRPSTICKMVDAQTWAEYCERFPEVANIRHDGGAPRTGTSLGYNALWYGPYVDAEIVSERDDGSLVGEWIGPNGPEPYDVEHVVDPECELVQRLARNTGFDPKVLGGQHFAVCLAALGGRGAGQSELMRVVDSLDLPIVGDRARPFARVVVQVPCTDTDAALDAADVEKSIQQEPEATPLSAREEKTMQKIAVEIALGRDNVKALDKLGLKPFRSSTLTLDEDVGGKLREVLVDVQAMIGELIEMASEAKGEAAAAEGKMADMVPAAEAQQKVDELKTMLAEAEKALAESKAAEKKTADERDAAVKARDALQVELVEAPKRLAELQTFRDDAIARGFDKDKVAACVDAAALRRMVVAEKVGGDRYNKTRDDGSYVADDSTVQATFDGVWAMLKPVQAPANGEGAGSESQQPSSFTGFPRIAPANDANNNPNPAPVSTTEAELNAGMSGF